MIDYAALWIMVTITTIAVLLMLRNSIVVSARIRMIVECFERARALIGTSDFNPYTITSLFDALGSYEACLLDLTCWTYPQFKRRAERRRARQKKVS